MVTQLGEAAGATAVTVNIQQLPTHPHFDGLQHAAGTNVGS